MSKGKVGGSAAAAAVIGSGFEGIQLPPPGNQYRRSVIGLTLIASLDELVAEKRITPETKEKILIHFDVAIAANLGRCASRMTFVAEKLGTYHADNKTYMLKFKNIEVCSRGRKSTRNLGCFKEIVLVAHPPFIPKKKKVGGSTEENDELAEAASAVVDDVPIIYQGSDTDESESD